MANPVEIGLSRAGAHLEAVAASSASSGGGALLSQGLFQQLHFYTVGVFEKYGDPRVSNYHLMRTPWPTIGATLIYLWFVKVAGPRMMRNRKPYEILPLIRVYNLMMAAWNGIGFLYASHLVGYGSDLVGCQIVDPHQRDEKTLSTIYYGWMFFTSRIIEFADTIFFTLRKKNSQVTAFHVFHHSTVPTIVWFFLKFTPGGNSGIFPFINTVIHTIMYTYYFLATYPSMHPYLGWKKYLTQLQIVQFIIIIACCLQPMFIPGCKVPKVLVFIMVSFSIIFICLFVNFYFFAYRKQTSDEHSKTKQNQKKQDEHVSEVNYDNNNRSAAKNRNCESSIREVSTAKTKSKQSTREPSPQPMLAANTKKHQ